MNSGLLATDLDRMRLAFKKHPNIKRVILFGSRAMGNYKEGSDIDLALVGKIDFNDLRQVRSELNEHSMLPYFFDVIDYQTIENPALREHIDKFGVVIFTP